MKCPGWQADKVKAAAFVSHSSTSLPGIRTTLMQENSSFSLLTSGCSQSLFVNALRSFPLKVIWIQGPWEIINSLNCSSRGCQLSPWAITLTSWSHLPLQVSALFHLVSRLCFGDRWKASLGISFGLTLNAMNWLWWHYGTFLKPEGDCPWRIFQSWSQNWV